MTKVMQKELKKTIAPFEKANLKNSTIQILNTIIPFFLLWYLAYESLALSYLITLPIVGLAAGFLVRIFIIFHDCCHQSFFKNKKANEIVGIFTGILTLFPYYQWRHCHNIHHATSSNLNKRGTGDIWIMTVKEYSEASFLQRMSYRFYRNPLVMFGLGPLYLFLVSNRFNRKGARVKERINTYFTTVSAVILYSLISWVIGWQAFVLVQGPILFVSGALGIWLFYVQHHFEDSYFELEENWDFVKAAVEGSSFYKLPKILQWLTGNIGYHHVHHLSPRVPNYYLEDVHEQNIPLKSVPTVTIRSSFNSIRYRLWDEANKQFVSFREIKKRTVEQKFSHKIVD